MSMIVGDGEEKFRTLSALIFCLAFFWIGMLCILKMKEEKNREKAERELS